MVGTSGQSFAGQGGIAAMHRIDAPYSAEAKQGEALMLWHACRIRWSSELQARCMSVDASVIEPPLFFGLPSAAPAMSDVQLFDLSCSRSVNVLSITLN